MDTLSGAVFVQTNDADANSVLAFGRKDDGSLSPLGSYATGGRGNGTPHLPSLGSLVVGTALPAASRASGWRPTARSRRLPARRLR